MKQSLRLSIPTPCTEDWEKMLPAERGRHCEQCCKTVVDFTGMSDAEVVRFFVERAKGERGGVANGAGSGGVCGRLAKDQLERELAPAPVQRNGFKGWTLVVAGALVMGKGPGSGRLGKARVQGLIADPGVPDSGVVVQVGDAHEMPDTTDRVFLGGIGVDEVVEPPVIREDTGMADIGVLHAGDTENRAVDPKVAEMPADTVVALTTKLEDAIAGGVVAVGPEDTAGRWRRAALDSLGGWIKKAADTVAALMPGARPEDMVTVYPNPVMRGGMIRLGWKVESGRYQVAMISARGALVQERVVEVGGKGQVDEWALPNGLAAGVYFVRVAREGGVARAGERPYTVEVVVQ